MTSFVNDLCERVVCVILSCFEEDFVVCLAQVLFVIHTFVLKLKCFVMLILDLTLHHLDLTFIFINFDSVFLV